jgi:hypothetical protein
MISYNKILIVLIAFIFASSVYSSDVRYGVHKAPQVNSAEGTADALMKSELDIGSDLDVGAALARAEAVQRKSKEEFRFKQEETQPKLHNTIVKSGAAPKLAAAAPPAMEMPQHKQHSSIFAPQKHSLFSWARSFVEPKAKVQHKEQHAHQHSVKNSYIKAANSLKHRQHAAPVRQQEQHRFVQTNLNVQEAASPKPAPKPAPMPAADLDQPSNETNKTQAATGVHELVSTLSGSFVVSGLSDQMELKRLDNFGKKALSAVTNYTKDSGKGIIVVDAMLMELKLKKVAESPPVKLVSLNATNVTNVTELNGEDNDVASEENINKIIDGDSTSMLIDLDQSKGLRVRMNFAIRGIRMESKEWLSEAKDSIQSLVIVPKGVNETNETMLAREKSTALLKKFQAVFAAYGNVTVSQMVISEFRGESFDVCPSLCSGNGVCEASGACKCKDGYADADCSDERCIGGCGRHGQCNETAKECMCDNGFAGEKCEKEACPNQCSKHGMCEKKSGDCICHQDWQGYDCSTPRCTKNCSNHGTCVATPAGPVCTCDQEWSGDYCNTPACPTSEKTLEKQCSGNGKCESGKCICRSGFVGEDCSEEYCPANCNGKGVCKNWACECFDGYEGVSCNRKSCATGCEKHGACENGTCICNKGFTGSACQKLICKADCNGRGLCINTKACVAHSDNCTKEHQCKCEQGYGGETCEKKLCPGSCGAKYGGKSGQCDYATGVCNCGVNFYGMECQYLRCPSRGGPRSGCSGHGRCDGKGKCQCDAGWIPGLRKDCNWKACPFSCSGNGACLNGTCTCNDGFSGKRCNIAECPGETPCSSRGICNSTDGTCSCKQGFTGPACQLTACPMNCNGKGDCDKNGKCVCHAGYSGDDCSTRYVVHGEILDEAKGIVECYHGYGGPDCNTKLCRSNCSHRGICVQGTCYCKPSWTGDHCQHAACPNECYYKGECKLGVCKCDEGYRGVDCSRRHVENGVCHVATGECECNKVAEKGAAFKGQMWTGESCNHKTCLNNCTNSKHGTCNGKLGVCECDPDWMGISCEKHACPYACHGNGLCKEGTCECNDMWGGEACEQRLYWCPLDCNKNGDCVKKTNKNGTATHSCKCNALPEKVVGGKRLTAMFPGQKYKGSTCAELSCPLGPKGNECSGKGVCSKGKCTCNNLFGGKACQLSVCKDACHYNGACVHKKGSDAATCNCDDGWTGETCGLKQCLGRGKCSGHGTCDEKSSTCKCHAGWSDKKCSTPKCPANCNGESHGVCTAKGCACKPGWTGDTCGQRSCPLQCSKAGACVDGKCKCDDYHTGEYCQNRKCLKDCTGHGVCDKKTFTCNCAPGFKGESCEKTTCGHSCGKHGSCVVDDAGVTAKCQCDPGYTGGLCEQTCSCNGRGVCGMSSEGVPKCIKCDAGYGGENCEKQCPNKCSGHGECDSTGKCKCNQGFVGVSCVLKACPKQCSGHGLCQKTGFCKCSDGYAGDACDVFFWRCEKNCNNHGTCIKGNNGKHKCECDSKWTGALCDIEVCDPLCKNGGVCKNQTCFCMKGFAGRTCNLRVCPKNCMQHGRCLSNGRCKCDPGFKGKACSIRYVVNGKCSIVSKKCTCFEVDSVNATFAGQRWRGPACLAKTCPNNCTSPVNGVCQADGHCACRKGEWTGRDCSVPVCLNLCSGKGKCRQGACKCDEGYSGKDCSTFDSQYECPKACNQRGACVDKKCKCKIGFEGKACEFVKCPAKCSIHGRCARDGTGAPICVCKAGYTGIACMKTCRGGPTCSKNGICSVSNGTATCVCEQGFAGKACQLSCPDKCSGRGACYVTAAGLPECACRGGYSGWSCEKKPCPRECSQHGICNEGKCTCEADYTGDDCSTRRCSNDCSGKGACSGAPDYKCICQNGFTGEDCKEKVSCINDCSGHGECSMVKQGKAVVAKCVCEFGFGGLDCSGKVCAKDITGRECAGKGECKNGLCKCQPGFSGDACNVHDCKTAANGKSCSGNGFCNEKGTCVCDSGWINAECSTRICPLGVGHKVCSGRGLCEESACVCDDEFFGNACELGGTKSLASSIVDAKVKNETAKEEKAAPSEVTNEIEELKKMVVNAKSDPMEQASIEKVLREKEEAAKESKETTILNETEMDTALLKVTEEEERIAKLKAEKEAAEKARNPTDVAIIEKKLAAEERGLAASKVEEEVALENKETEEAAKGVKEVKNTTKKEVKVVEKRVPVAANVSGCGECFNGKCTDGICLCKEGWMGKSCNKQTCGKGCVHGTCLNGACECDVDKETGLPAFFGQSCELRQCPGSFVKGEFKACSGNGACMSVGDKAKDAVCDCQDGYSRSDCSLATTTDESSPIADCNSKCVSKCQKKSGGNSDKYLNCFGKCSSRCGGVQRNKVPFNVTKDAPVTIKMPSKKVMKEIVKEVDSHDMEKNIAKAEEELKGDAEAQVKPSTLVHKLDTVKSSMQHILNEGVKDDTMHGVYIDANLRCDQCMKDTLEKIVSSKNADQPLATFLGRLCEEAGKKKCDKFKAALMGNTEAKGRKKAVKWYCSKVHNLCKEQPQ